LDLQGEIEDVYMNIIEVDVGKTKLFSIGQQYNNNALVIHFVNLPNQKNKYIYYKIDDIEEEIPLVSDLFIASRPLMLHSGEVKAQIITRDENNSIIELTKNFTMRIQPSNYSGIGEDENYPDDPNIKNYYVKIDGKIQSMDELIALVQSKLDNGEFVGVQGPKGEKGDPGDVTEEYRNLANQVAQNATSAQKALDDTKEFVNQTKTELNQIKTDTSALKDEANTSAVNAKASEDKAKEYADNLQASTDDISKLKEDLVANTKEDAKTKRSLSALWALNNGISYRFETDSEKAYQKKVLSGAKLASVNKVGGKTIVMNQIFKIASISANGLTFSVDSDGLITINGTASSYFATLSQINDLQNKEGKFFAKMTIVENPNTVAFKFGYTNRNKFTDAISSGSTSTIFTQTNAELAKAKYQGIAGFQEGTVFDNVKVKIMIFNLTKMFGSGNEPTTPEEFEAMFPNDYYAYNEGELMSMSVNDVVYTDTSSNQNSHQIPQSILSLDGYGWSAGTAYNYVDFENKKYYKCVDKVNLGTLDYQNGNNVSFVSEGLKGYKLTNKYSTVPNIVCKKYEAKSQNQMRGNKDVTGISVNALSDGYLYINDLSFSDAESFKNALQGVYLYYELAEPIVTDISDIIGDTFQESLNVESGGSLTFKNTNGDGYRIAVPSDIQYTVALSEVNA
jgi:hypothetical protein